MSIPPPPNPANSITVTAQDIISAALQEIGALAPGEAVSNDDNPWVLQKLQRLIDRYNAREAMIYNVNFVRFTIPTALQPIPIGPLGFGPGFSVIQRPVVIKSASLILSNTSPTEVEIPIYVRDEAWWADNRTKNLQSTLPTDLYYSPDWPIGQIFLWPVPTDVNDIRLEMRTVLIEMTGYRQQFSLPPGYWDAVIYPLAVSLCPSYKVSASPELIKLEQQSIKAIQTNNIASPRGTTGDAGMPGTGSRGDFNYYSGMPNFS
jgi:hypothetical protein